MAKRFAQECPGHPRWGSRPDISPDKTDGRGGLRCRLAVVALPADGKTAELLVLVPEGTKSRPFTLKVPQGVARLALRINDNDGEWSRNPGKVQYKITVTRP